MTFLLLRWMKTEGPEVPESYKTCKAGMLLPRTWCHLWLLTLPSPQESLETGIHHWGFKKAALVYWATGFMKLSLLSYLWCRSALQPIAKWQFLIAFLPSILYIFTLDSLMSVLTQTQISWEKKYITYMYLHTPFYASRALGHKVKQEIRKSHSLGSLCNLSFPSMCRRFMITSQMKWSQPISSTQSLSQCSGSLVSGANKKCRDPGSAIWQYPTSCEDVGKWSRGLQGEKSGVTGPVCFLAVIAALGAFKNYIKFQLQ